MDPFLSFPDDKLYEICELLDDNSLGKFLTTSKHVREVCQDVANRRKERIDFLVSELIGKWAKCIDGQLSFVYISGNHVDDNLIDIDMDAGDEALFEEMEYEFDIDIYRSSYIGMIEKSLYDLEFLYSELLSRGYKKIPEDYWGYVKADGTYFQTKHKYINLYTGRETEINYWKPELVELADQLGIKGSILRSPEELRDLIVEELTKQDKMFFCNV